MRIPSNDHVLHIEESRGRSVAKLGLRALSNNVNAIRLYQRYGFTEEGRLKAELRRPDGSCADDIWMALWLRPPAMGTPAAT
jgi:ribosomal protein S18 acetylase RimI-like enzyme